MNFNPLSLQQALAGTAGMAKSSPAKEALGGLLKQGVDQAGAAVGTGIGEVTKTLGEMEGIGFI